MNKIKTYNNLTVLGSATLLLTGWSTETHMFYQWFLHFESSEPEKSETGECQILNCDWEKFHEKTSKKKRLESFMDIGLKEAESTLVQFLSERIEGKTIEFWPETKFEESRDYIGAVMYLKRKFGSYFEMMSEQVKQSKLKECIKIAKGIQYLK